MKKVKTILISLVIILILTVAISMALKTKTPTPASPEPSMSNNENAAEKIIVRGKIIKEKIPQELELGDYWYWIYLDSPFLLEDNASGEPAYVDKLEVWEDAHNIDTLLNKDVEIIGTLTWGYAESRVILLESVTEIK